MPREMDWPWALGQTHVISSMLVMLGIPQGLEKPTGSPSHCLQPASGQLRCLPRILKCNEQDLSCCAHSPAMPRDSEYREVGGCGWGLTLGPAE